MQNHWWTLSKSHISPEVIFIAWSACVQHTSFYSHFSVLSHFPVQFDSSSKSSGNLPSGGKTGGILERTGGVMGFWRNCGWEVFLVQGDGRGGVAGSGRLIVCSLSHVMDDNNNNKYSIYIICIVCFFLSKCKDISQWNYKHIHSEKNMNENYKSSVFKLWTLWKFKISVWKLFMLYIVCLLVKCCCTFARQTDCYLAGWLFG